MLQPPEGQPAGICGMSQEPPWQGRLDEDDATDGEKVDISLATFELPHPGQAIFLKPSLESRMTSKLCLHFLQRYS